MNSEFRIHIILTPFRGQGADEEIRILRLPQHNNEYRSMK